MAYTPKQLDEAALHDLLTDARVSREQAKTGPFWPDRGISSESLIAYAEKCEARAAQYANSGAHKAVIKGE